MPTVLEGLGIKQPTDIDGRSFFSLLHGKTQTGRDQVFTQFHETAGRRRYPMRAIHNERYVYLFNPWSDGKRIFKNESQSGRTFKAMKQAALTDEAIAKRVKLFQYREVEEFYDTQKDPDSTVNLINSPEHKKIIDQMRSDLLKWMQKTKDPAHQALANHKDPTALQEFMNQQDLKGKRNKQRKKKRKKSHQLPKKSL